MIRAAPGVGLGVLALLMAGAVWLYAVRGEAMLMDLQGLAGRVWCF